MSPAPNVRRGMFSGLLGELGGVPFSHAGFRETYAGVPFSHAATRSFFWHSGGSLQMHHSGGRGGIILMLICFTFTRSCAELPKHNTDTLVYGLILTCI